MFWKFVPELWCTPTADPERRVAYSIWDGGGNSGNSGNTEQVPDDPSALVQGSYHRGRPEMRCDPNPFAALYTLYFCNSVLWQTRWGSQAAACHRDSVVIDGYNVVIVTCLSFLACHVLSAI